MTKCAPLILAIALLLTVQAAAQDADGDRIPDQIEEALGTDADFAEKLELVGDSSVNDALTGDDARFDIRRVYFGNVARGRWLWRIEFAATYRFENASIIVYVDSDNNPETGRPGMGCETTYGHSGGSPSQMFYLAADRAAEFPRPRVAIADGALYICADLPLNQQDGRSAFRAMILSEQRTPHESRDALGWRDITAPGNSERERVTTLADLTENENFLDTQNAELLWEIQADERNVILNSFQDCEYEGFAYNHSEYRWPALRKASGAGSIRATVPRAGKFFPGVVVCDGSGAEGWEMLIGGESVGRFPLNEDNNRQRLFFLPEAVDLRDGEVIELRPAASGGQHIIEDIVLLADRPAVLVPPREIRNLAVTWDWERERHRVTWVTTWPVTCTVTVTGQRIAEEKPIQNHRIYLPEMAASGRLQCSVLARNDRDDEDVTAEIQFAAAPPEPPQGSVARDEIALTVAEDSQGYPLTAGIPFAQGVLGRADNLRVMASRGGEMPLQARPLVRWPDGSVKIALLDTFAPLGSDLKLEYGREVTRTEVRNGVQVSQAADSILVDTRALQVEFDAAASGLFTSVEQDGRQLLRPDAPPRIVLTDETGKVYDTLGAPDSIVVEEAGPMRTVIRADGHHTGDTGELFTYEIRFTFHRGAPVIGVSYRWSNDRSDGLSVVFRRIRLELPLALADGAEVLIGADEPVTAALNSDSRLAQLRDDNYTTGDQTGKRAPGWVAASDEAASAMMICRDFWQLYPKAIGTEDGVLYLDICPELGATEYNDCTERELYKLYYYLQDGLYKVRQGASKTHEVWVVLDTGVEAMDVATCNGMTEFINMPPVLAASPEYYAASGVFGDFVPATAEITPRYEDICDRAYRSYTDRRESVREYGMLNYGDQWGERGANWSNGEYDHHYTAAQMFVRSGEPRWHSLMQTMARHDIDVDLCHHDTGGRRGGSWSHSIGHTGSYLDTRMEGKYGTPRAGQSPTHTWTAGTCDYYMLTGDPTAIEAARMISDHYGGSYLNNYDFTNGRVPGWHLIQVMATYRTTYDPFYLNAARIIIERVLERRTPGGGWDRQMVPGHCHCEPRCRGLCSFMQGILGVGLREYWRETSDERIPPAVVDSARHVIDEIWDEETEMLRYTSCPTSSLTASRADTLGGLFLFAYEHSGDPRILDVAVRGLDVGLASTTSMAHMRWTPYIMYALAGIEREAVAAGRESPVRVLLLPHKKAELPEATLPPPELAGAKTVVYAPAEDFSAQGAGEVRVVDRIGNVGKMITMWHADLGHWLEWKVKVPADGQYAIWARYATNSAVSRRSLSIDGEPPREEYREIEFKRTGGFCTDTDNWVMRKMGPAIRLKAGPHTIRMTNLGEGLALDYLAVVGE